MAISRGIIGLNSSQTDEVGIEVVVFLTSHVGEMGLEGVGGATFDTPLGAVEHGDVVHTADMLEIHGIQQHKELSVLFLVQFSLSFMGMIGCFPCMLVDGIIQFFPIEYVAGSGVFDAESERRME